MTELEEKLWDVIQAVKKVIPTSENCPIKKPLEELLEYADDVDAKTFMNQWKYDGKERSTEFVRNLVTLKD